MKYGLRSDFNWYRVCVAQECIVQFLAEVSRENLGFEKEFDDV